VRLSRIRVRDFLGIEDIEVVPGHVNVISGANAVGKSSLLEAIRAAFRARSLEANVIHAGADKAEILVELDSGQSIARSITDRGKPVVVTEGKAVRPKPQEWLDSLLGEPGFGFEPVAFFQADAKEQRRILLGALDIAVTAREFADLIGTVPPETMQGVGLSGPALEVLERFRERVYELRRIKNAEADAARAAAETEAAKVPKGFDPEPFRRDVREWYEIASDARQAMVEQEGRAQKIMALSETEAGLALAISEVEARLASLQERRAKTRDERAKIQAEATAFVAPDLEGIRAKIEAHEAGRRALEAKESAAAWEKREEALLDAAKELDALHRRLVKDVPRKILSRSKVPLGDISVRSDGVYLGDSPLAKLSTSERMRFALKLARLLAGELKIVCLDGAEALDADTYAALMAEIEADESFQYFVTRVTEGALQVEARE